MPFTGQFLFHDDVTFAVIANRVGRDHGLNVAGAERRLDQAILFVAAAAKLPGVSLYAPPEIAKAWRTFFFFDRHYMPFCLRMGSKVMLEPCGTAARTPGRRGYVLNLQHTMSRIKQQGGILHDELWYDSSNNPNRLGPPQPAAE